MKRRPENVVLIVFYSLMCVADLAGVALRPHNAFIFALLLTWFAGRLGAEVVRHGK